MKAFFVQLAAVLAFAGCTGANTDTAPLIFGQSQTVGLSITPSATGTGGEVSFGYRDGNLAVIPTIIPSVQPFESGDTAHKLVSFGADGADEIDAYSTFGQFEFKTTGTDIGLGKFFATGVAAQNLAQGFGCAAAGVKDTKCVRRPPTTGSNSN